MFIGNFCCAPEGRTAAEELIGQGADVIMPVAGPWVGFGALEAISEHEGVYFIGVDIDQVKATPSYADVILTSVEKRLDTSMLLAAKAYSEGTFSGGFHLGTLATDEVGLSPFYENEERVPESIRADLEMIKRDIAAERIRTKP